MASEDIRRYWQIRGLAPKLKASLERFMFDNRKRKQVSPWKGNKPLHSLYKMVRSKWFDNLMQFVVLLNIPFIIWDIQTDIDISSPDITAKEEQTYWNILIANYIFFFIYLTEFLLKIIGLCPKLYFSDWWNGFDFFILFTAFIDVSLVTLAILTEDDSGSGGGSFDNFLKIFKSFKFLKMSKMIKFLKVLRSLRMLRFMKTALPFFVDSLERRIHADLAFGYSVGRCFIRGQDELVTILPTMIENKVHLTNFREQAEKNRLEVVRELGMLQRDTPGLAVSIKTRTACRTILNAQRDQVRILHTQGVLDEHETKLLENEVEKNMKDIAYGFPKIVEPPSDFELLENIPWISESEEMRKFFQNCAEKLELDCGDILIQEGEDVDGIYLITTGMARISGSGLNPDQEIDENKLYGTSDDVGLDPTVYTNTNKFDYVCSGGLVGDVGVMTGQSDITAICETALTCFLIKIEDIEEALELYPSLEEKIWKCIGINIAITSISDLMDIGATAEKRRQYLEPSYLVNLSKGESFVFDESSESCIVIFGEVEVTYSVNKRLAANKKFQPKTLKAPDLVKHVYDNNFKLVEQSIKPIWNNENDTSPKLLIVPKTVQEFEDTQKMFERLTTMNTQFINNNSRSNRLSSLQRPAGLQLAVPGSGLGKVHSIVEDEEDV